MKQLISLFLLVVVITSCSIERRHYLPGFHVEVRGATYEVRGTQCEGSHKRKEDDSLLGKHLRETSYTSEIVTSSVIQDIADTMSSSYPITAQTYPNVGLSSRTLHPSHFALRTSSFAPDTLKKPFKPQQQYREVDPVGKASVIVVLAGVALQKIVGLLTWYEVAMPLVFGPGIFIPALIIALIGVGLSAYSAYRVRKNPEKYKKNEWGKASLAILGWQVLMTVLFAWLLM